MRASEMTEHRIAQTLLEHWDLRGGSPAANQRTWVLTTCVGFPGWLGGPLLGYLAHVGNGTSWKLEVFPASAWYVVAVRGTQRACGLAGIFWARPSDTYLPTTIEYMGFRMVISSLMHNLGGSPNPEGSPLPGVVVEFNHIICKPISR